jgi:hypothetical protein
MSLPDGGIVTETGERHASPCDILDYYFRTVDEARPLNEAKLILVGFGEVGKSLTGIFLAHINELQVRRLSESWGRNVENPCDSKEQAKPILRK